MQNSILKRFGQIKNKALYIFAFWVALYLSIFLIRKDSNPNFKRLEKVFSSVYSLDMTKHFHVWALQIR